MRTFNYPVGYIDLHKIKMIDFSLNRWYSFGYTRLEDIKDAAAKITDMDDWPAVMIELADKAYAEKRYMNATFYYRAAEFFIDPKEPLKDELYEKFIDLFYNVVFKDDPIEIGKIPYEGSYLHTMHLKCENAKGDMLIHGGKDSFIEELYSIGCYFRNEGYNVILFDGPGQGKTLKEYRIPLDYMWEKPVKAVLDYYKIEDATLLGLSMGGWMCFRAAAYEPRVKRVIASSIAYDYMKLIPSFMTGFVNWCVENPSVYNFLQKKKEKRPTERWGAMNLRTITMQDDSRLAAKEFMKFNAENLKSELVTQDVFILTGKEDHFIPYKLHELQVKALKNAKSLKANVYTREQQAHNHCQIGNMGLALKDMRDWLAEITSTK